MTLDSTIKIKFLLGLTLVLSILSVTSKPVYANLEDFIFSPMVGPIKYVEDYYRIYTYGNQSQSLFQQEQLRFLHLAAQARFKGIHASLAVIHNRLEFRQYQYLIYFRLAHLLTKNYMIYASRYDKPDVTWIDSKYKDIWGKSFSRALRYYRMAHYYWSKTIYFAGKAYSGRNTELAGPEMANIQSDVSCVIEADFKTQLNRINLLTTDRERYLDCNLGRKLNNRVKDLKRKTNELGVKLEPPLDYKQVVAARKKEFNTILK